MPNHQYDYDLVCLGCGAAGEKAATQAAYYRHRVAVVDAQARPGGAMVNTGTVPSKALRETALLCSAFRRRPLPGMDFLIDHDISIARFSARRHLVVQQEHDRIEASIDRHGIDVLNGWGRIEDPHTLSIDDGAGHSRIVTARYILIATGSSPVRPDHIPFESPSVVDADGILELESIPKSLVIVGGGVIGCEYATIFAEIGVRITLIHPQSNVLPFVDAECRDLLCRSMRDVGVEFRLDSAVEQVTAHEAGGVTVHLEGGDTIDASVLLWAAGRQGNTRGIGLENVGIEPNKRGVVQVGDKYRTEVDSIYAAGDVIGFPSLAATSMEQGRIAACDMFGLDFKQELAALLPIGIYTVPAISMIGLTEAEARAQDRKFVVGRAGYRDNVRGRMIGDDTGLLKCVFSYPGRCLIGVSVVGADATELIHIGQTVMAHGAGIDYFIGTCFNYPSLSELYKYAAYSALQEIAEREGHVAELAGQARVA